MHVFNTCASAASRLTFLSLPKPSCVPKQIKISLVKTLVGIFCWHFYFWSFGVFSSKLKPHCVHVDKRDWAQSFQAEPPPVRIWGLEGVWDAGGCVDEVIMSLSRHTQQTVCVLCQALRTCFSSCDFVLHPHPRGCSPSQSLSHLLRGQRVLWGCWRGEKCWGAAPVQGLFK